ncbi:MAG: zinc ribbon domain-containing protein [Planctomycetes bacterium]|nr:zinc ribbon domain-containing protein [Planctomycetota bacterium]
MSPPTRCSVCHGVLDEEDLFCPNCGTESPHPQQAAPVAQLSTHNFKCSGCGASMSYDASAGTLRCPFCGSLKLEAQPDAQTLIAEVVVPFQLTREQAVSQMRAWLGQGFWRPGDLSTQALVVSMTPVYVPYWIFEATTQTYWTADTSQTPAGASGDWFPLFGQREGSYNGLLVGASGALTAAETAELSPFDLAPGVPPEQVDLDNAIFEQFSVPRKYARPLARSGLEALEIEACTREVPLKARNVKVSMLVGGLTSRPVLLPVWIMAYRYREQVFRFLVNGQTGSSTGRAPFSYRKLIAAGAIALGVLLLIFLLIFAAQK